MFERNTHNKKYQRINVKKMKVSIFMINLYVLVVVILILFIIYLLTRSTTLTEIDAIIPERVVSNGRVTPMSSTVEKTPTYPSKSPEYPTRYNNDSFEQIGTLSSTSADGENGNKIILPLFARRLHHDRYEYYTVTENDMKLRIDIRHNNRVCSDKQIGCDEIYDGDTVVVPSYDQEFVVSRYQYRVV